jgi:hypothetical protein
VNRLARTLARGLILETLAVTAAAVAVVAHQQRRFAALERALVAKNLAGSQVQAARSLASDVSAQVRVAGERIRERAGYRLENGDLDVAPVDS